MYLQNPEVFSADPVGSLSATCTANPYAGITQTFLALSQGGALATDSIGADSVQAVGAGVGVAPTTYNVPVSATDAQLAPGNTLPLIPAGATSAEIQALATGFCPSPDGIVVPSTCSADLRIRGTNPRNKFPGSQLAYDYATETTFATAGATYTTQTHYTLR